MEPMGDAGRSRSLPGPKLMGARSGASVRLSLCSNPNSPTRYLRLPTARAAAA